MLQLFFSFQNDYFYIKKDILFDNLNDNRKNNITIKKQINNDKWNDNLMTARRNNNTTNLQKTTKFVLPIYIYMYLYLPSYSLPLTNLHTPCPWGRSSLTKPKIKTREQRKGKKGKKQFKKLKVEYHNK